MPEEPEVRSEDDEDDMVERRTQPQAEEEDEDNTLSLAQMEEQLKPLALERFAQITATYKKFSKVQQARLEAFGNAQAFAPAKTHSLPSRPTHSVSHATDRPAAARSAAKRSPVHCTVWYSPLVSPSPLRIATRNAPPGFRCR